MQQVQQQIHQILTQNQGNRLTFELINGLTARLQMIVAEHGRGEAEKAREEAARLEGQAGEERGNG